MRRRCVTERRDFTLKGTEAGTSLLPFCSEKIIWFGNAVRSMTVRRYGSGDWQGSDDEGYAKVLSFIR